MYSCKRKFFFFFVICLFLKKNRGRYKYNKNHMTCIYNFTDKKHLIYQNKHFATLNWNFKHQGQFQMATIVYIYIFFV
jgi:hypothetical protein